MATARPNVIVIMADDMGYGDLACLNGGINATPALDRLYSQSLAFTQGYAASCVCAPSRAGFLCGRYPVRTGCTCLNAYHSLNQLSPDEITIADIFKSGGYRTGLVGKWHCGEVAGSRPEHCGFTDLAAYHPQGMDHWNWELDLGGTTHRSNGNEYLGDALTDYALDFIRNSKDKPFFLHLAYYAPHRPLQAPQDLLDKYQARGDLTAGQAIVYAMIESMDTGIGRISDELKKLGLDRNTIVIFTSDNGPDTYEANGISPQRQNCGLRGHKYSVFEGGIRIPLLVRWPDGLAHTGSNDALFHFIDLLPTLADACNLALPAQAHLDGDSRLKLWQGDEANVNPVRFWHWNRYFPEPGCNAAMRDGNWKLVMPALTGYNSMTQDNVDMVLGHKPFTPTPPEPLNLGPSLAPLLFDLSRDPNETQNLADMHTPRVNAMRKAILNWQRDTQGDFIRAVAKRFPEHDYGTHLGTTCPI
jgi:arylsulfatase A